MAEGVYCELRESLLALDPQGHAVPAFSARLMDAIAQHKGKGPFDALGNQLGLACKQYTDGSGDAAVAAATLVGRSLLVVRVLAVAATSEQEQQEARQQLGVLLAALQQLEKEGTALPAAPVCAFLCSPDLVTTAGGRRAAVRVAITLHMHPATTAAADHPVPATATPAAAAATSAAAAVPPLAHALAQLWQLLLAHSEHALLVDLHLHLRYGAGTAAVAVAEAARLYGAGGAVAELRSAAVMEPLLAAKKWQLARQLARGVLEAGRGGGGVCSDSGLELARSLIAAALEAQEYKIADDCTQEFRLRSEFPQAQALRRRQTLSRLVSQKKWQIACAMVLPRDGSGESGNDGGGGGSGGDAAEGASGGSLEWRRYVLQLIEEAGDYRVLASAAAELRLPLTEPQQVAVAVAAAVAARLPSPYLALALATEAVVVVNNRATLAHATAELTALLSAASTADSAVADDPARRYVASACLGERPPAPPPAPGAAAAEGKCGGGGALPCVVGLDVEWRLVTQGNKHKRGGGKSAAASATAPNGRPELLQLATATHAFLFDLPALCSNAHAYGAASATAAASTGGGRNRHGSRMSHGASKGGGSGGGDGGGGDTALCERFDQLIGSILASPRVACVGFAFRSDLQQLQQGWPHVSGFRQLMALLDLRNAGRQRWAAAFQPQAPGGGGAGGARGGHGRPAAVGTKRTASGSACAAGGPHQPQPTTPTACTPAAAATTAAAAGASAAAADGAGVSLPPGFVQPSAQTNSLSGTCAAWLGAPLDKTQQCSNWGRRPLSTEQIEYAAQDAHCLVRVFAEMHSCMLAAGYGSRWWEPLLEYIP